VIAICERVTSPSLVIHGAEDGVVPPEIGRRLAGVLGARCLVLPGAGHCPQARKPVAVNLAIREFAESCSRSPPAPALRAT
jgi:pimeloyl-ACP methyl ester carboxylesterase